MHTLELLKSDRVPDRIIVNTPVKDDDAARVVRCPQCGWQPAASSRWCCDSVDGPEPPFDSCGTIWNTFATSGRCPGCAHQWRWTSCLRCQQWSLHEEWYGSARR
jgi:hypothetical protein